MTEFDHNTIADYPALIGRSIAYDAKRLKKAHNGSKTGNLLENIFPNVVER